MLAVGEEIKLRSDCIRETPEDEEGSELKRWDVYDFSVVLLQSLTQHKTLEDAERELPLQQPFDEIVRKGMSGEWGLREIASALNPGLDVSSVAPPVARPVAPPEVAVERPVASLPEAQPVPVRSAPVPVEEEPRGIEVNRLSLVLARCCCCCWFGFLCMAERSRTVRRRRALLRLRLPRGAMRLQRRVPLRLRLRLVLLR